MIDQKIGVVAKISPIEGAEVFDRIQYNIRLIKVDRTQLQTRHSKNHTLQSIRIFINYCLMIKCRWLIC